MIGANDNRIGHRVVAVQRGGEDEGEFCGLYLVTVEDTGAREPVDGKILETRAEAFATAWQFAQTHQPALVHDLTGETA